MNILAAHLNTNRATEMYLTILELADIGGQNVIYHTILYKTFRAIAAISSKIELCGILHFDSLCLPIPKW